MKWSGESMVLLALEVAAPVRAIYRRASLDWLSVILRDWSGS